MLKDNAKKYFLDQDFNCAETTLKIINDQYDLGLTDEDFKLFGGFGGGFGCGITCGILVSDIAAISKFAIKERAHATPGFKDLCEEYVTRFREKMGHTDCTPIRDCFFQEGRRCLNAVETAADLFEEFVAEKKLV